MEAKLKVDLGLRRAFRHIIIVFIFIFYKYEMFFMVLIVSFCVGELTNIDKLKKAMTRSLMEGILVVFICLKIQKSTKA